MNIMAGAAGTSHYALVDVDVMQIFAAIAELRQLLGLRRGKRFFFMTAEAKRIVLGIVCGIELRRVGIRQQPEVVAAVRHVAGAAILGSDRAMLMRIVGEQLADVGELLAFMVHNVVFAMALQAELHGELDEQVFHIGAVRVVAIDAFIARGERVVLDG
jgi:hypothetical protein